MTPIEIVAKTIARIQGCGLSINDEFELCTHPDADDENRQPPSGCECLQSARAALLALAECDLPRSVITDGANLISFEGGEYWKEKAELSLRAMLKAIAIGGDNE